MKSIKAIVVGSVFIIVAILLLQLLYIFVAVGYNVLAKDFPFLNDIAGSFRYIVGIPIFIATMFVGGYITANIADMETSIKVWLHCKKSQRPVSSSLYYRCWQQRQVAGIGKKIMD
jgi:hypothetical protein